jgi:hypothetical protein
MCVISHPASVGSAGDMGGPQCRILVVGADEHVLSGPCATDGWHGHCDVDLNHGVVTGDLRVLVTRTGADLSHMSMASLIRSLLVGGGWTVTVSPVGSAVVLAERRVGRRNTAERFRDEFVRVASEQKIDRSERSRIERLLGS